MKTEELRKTLDQIELSREKEEEIYRRILEGKDRKPARAIGKGSLKVAAIVLACLILGSGTAYAAKSIYKKIVVSNNVISVEGSKANNDLENELTKIEEGNDSEYVKEQKYNELLDDITNKFGEEEIENLSPGPNDRWISKKKSKLKYLGKTYMVGTEIEYENHEELISDLGHGFYAINHEEFQQTEHSTLYLYEKNDKVVGKRLHERYVSRMGGNVLIFMLIGEEFDPVSYSSGNQNVRTYVAKSGLEFTLVDTVWDEDLYQSNRASGWGMTRAICSFGDNFISLTIDHLTEEKIFELLDSFSLDLE